MRCLFVHNHYLERGGEDESVKAEIQMLRDQGHDVEVHIDTNERIAQIGKLSAGVQSIWSNPTYKAINQRLQSSTFDIVHIQNFFPLVSPAAHYAAKSNGVPVVQSLRNYRLICPNGLLHRNRQVCEQCVDKFIPLPGIQHKCYRNSYLASAVAATTLVTHRVLRTWQRQVDAFITPCEFTRQKFIQAGFPANKLFVKPNFVSFDPGFSELGGDHFLFVGRLAPEKGLEILVEAWSRLDQRLKLKIVGSGPLEEWIRSKACQHKHIEYLGFQPHAITQGLISQAKALIFPSTWYETFGRVVIEAFASGTPVIASDIGGIPEMVRHERNGLLFAPKDSEDLIDKVLCLDASPDNNQKMRRNARDDFERYYTAESNYRILMDIYQKAIASCQTPPIATLEARFGI
ncbi:MAG: glycosyltransferase family 4 protein [Cyanobacteria bacterium J06635_1]